jgi:hypothetical protein
MDILPSTNILQPKSYNDVLANRAALNKLVQFLTTPAKKAEYIFVTGASGCGRSTFCKIALKAAKACVLNMNDHYMQHQHTGTGINAQMEPKQILTNFANAMTIEQFVTRSVKVVYIDDIHVVSMRDRLLSSVLCGFDSRPEIFCKFMVSCHSDHEGRFLDFVKIAERNGHMYTLQCPTYKQIFAFARTVFTKHSLPFDDDRLLQMSKISSGNLHDFFSNVDHWLENSRSEISCKRDTMISLMPKELAYRLMYEIVDFNDVYKMVDCECGDLFMLIYENWHSIFKHVNNRRVTSPNVSSLFKSIFNIQNAFLKSLAMDQYAMLNTDWSLKDISTIYRYGSFISGVKKLRKEKSSNGVLNQALQRLSNGTKNHPSIVLGKITGFSCTDMSWQTLCDCCMESQDMSAEWNMTGSHTNIIKTYADYFKKKI